MKTLKSSIITIISFLTAVSAANQSQEKVSNGKMQSKETNALVEKLIDAEVYNKEKNTGDSPKCEACSTGSD